MTLEGLLGDDGDVDLAKVDAAIADAIAANGLTQVRNGPIIPGQGKEPSVPAKLATWESAFGPPVR